MKDGRGGAHRHLKLAGTEDTAMEMEWRRVLLGLFVGGEAVVMVGVDKNNVVN